MDGGTDWLGDSSITLIYFCRGTKTVFPVAPTFFLSFEFRNIAPSESRVTGRLKYFQHRNIFCVLKKTVITGGPFNILPNKIFALSKLKVHVLTDDKCFSFLDTGIFFLFPPQCFPEPFSFRGVRRRYFMVKG